MNKNKLVVIALIALIATVVLYTVAVVMIFVGESIITYLAAYGVSESMLQAMGLSVMVAHAMINLYYMKTDMGTMFMICTFTISITLGICVPAIAVLGLFELLVIPMSKKASHVFEVAVERNFGS